MELLPPALPPSEVSILGYVCERCNGKERMVVVSGLLKRADPEDSDGLYMYLLKGVPKAAGGFRQLNTRTLSFHVTVLGQQLGSRAMLRLGKAFRCQ